MKQLSNKADSMDRSEIMEKLIVGGDLKQLSPAERVIYYNKTCESLGLNPFTRPFEYVTLQGKLTLYARKDATEQLRKIHGISIVKLETKMVDGGVYVVTAYARTKDGQTDVGTGAVNVSGLKGDALANALMKAETKAKRRVTLSIGGLGMMDEAEIETIPNAQLQPPEEIPVPGMEELKAKILSTKTIDELRVLYENAYKPLKNHPSIVLLKDQQKAVLDSETQKFIQELGEPTSETTTESPL